MRTGWRSRRRKGFAATTHTYQGEVKRNLLSATLAVVVLLQLWFLSIEFSDVLLAGRD